MDPSSGHPGARSAAELTSPRVAPGAVAFVQAERRGAPRRARTFELRCADVHPVRCAASWRAGRVTDVVVLARGHGALAHGFTPVWYSEKRMDLIAAAVTQPGD